MRDKRQQVSTDARSRVVDGPFTEAKECAVGLSSRAIARRVTGAYADVHGLLMYYETQGRSRQRPLVLLHAGFTTIESSFGPVRHALALGRPVIAVEQQAHGRTADIDRPLSYEQMADDTAAILEQLDIEQADFFGFSMGASTALQIAVRYPELVNKLAVVSGAGLLDGYHDSAIDLLQHIRHDDELRTDLRARSFEPVGSAPERWAGAVARAKEVVTSCPGVRPQDLRGIRADALFVTGETGLVRLEHTREMSSLVPGGKLKVFDCDDHHPSMVRRAASLIPKFLAAPT
jgi:pimeloyl-ACP methyl ester carboxylesterase